MQVGVKKDGVVFVDKPHLLKMFPQVYQIRLQQKLKTIQYLTLKILVYLLECQEVSIELLASLMHCFIQFCLRAVVAVCKGSLNYLVSRLKASDFLSFKKF
jgi:hypothetical protein